MKLRSVPVAVVVVMSALSALMIVATSARAQTPAPAPAPGCVMLEVQNVRPERGMLMIAAYGDASSFESKTVLAATQMRAGPATMIFPLCHLNAASVSLLLYQDLNGNGKLDANAFGVPTEPWGASGKPAAMAAPTWDATAVPLDGTTIVVKLSK